MKRWVISILSIFLMSPAHAFDLEERMYLAEHYVSYTTSYDVSTDEKKLGTLYRRVLSLNTKYDYYNLQNKLLATAESHFFTFGAHLDVFDDNKVLLGTVEEKIFSWFPSFEIFSPDGVRLASASMNFWGTTFTLYDGRSTRVLAEMSRNFFRVRNYWTINIKDRERITERQIDPRLLLTVLAVQGDIEYLEQYRRRESERQERPYNPYPGPQASARRLTATQDDVKNMRNKYSDFLKKEKELNDALLPDAKRLDSLAQQLDKDFQQQYAGMELSSNERIERFVDYCIDIAEASGTTPDTQKAILHLLNKRFSEQAAK